MLHCASADSLCCLALVRGILSVAAQGDETRKGTRQVSKFKIRVKWILSSAEIQTHVQYVGWYDERAKPCRRHETEEIVQHDLYWGWYHFSRISQNQYAGLLYGNIRSTDFCKNVMKCIDLQGFSFEWPENKTAVI